MSMKRVLAGLSLALCADAHAAEACVERAQQILQALDRGEYEQARADFDARMQAGLSADQLAQVWKALPQQAGARKQVGPARLSGQTAIIPIDHALAWLELQVSCNSEGQVTGLYVRPGQAPAAPSAPEQSAVWTEQELEIATGALKLPGTLTLPREDLHAVVVLVHGSGAHDRDETIGPNKVFRDLAHGLAAHGIAVLRYEKRSKAKPEWFSGRSYTVQDEVIDDVLAALNALDAVERLQEQPRFVLGHSLGAMLAPRIASQRPGLAGIALLAAPARPLPDLIDEQMRYLVEVDGKVDEAERAKLKELEPVLARVRALSDDDRADPTPIFGAPAAYWLDLANYDPRAQARRLALPTLLLQGEGDYQVTMNKDYAQWTAALGKEAWFSAHSYAGLSHQFMPAGSPPSPADYQRPAQVDSKVIQTLADWITSTAAAADAG